MTIPNFVLQHSQQFIDAVEPFLSRLPRDVQSYLRRKFKKPNSSLLAMLHELNNVDELTNTPVRLLGAVNGVYRHKYYIGKIPFDFIELGARHLTLQEAGSIGCNLFSNPLHPPIMSDDTDDIIFDRDPKDRVGNNGMYVHTFEIDPPVECIREHLEAMIRTFFEPVENGKTRLELLYATLAKYNDFRGIEVIWSGNKSFHFHLVFDIRHLSPNQFDKRKDRTDSQHLPDLPQAMLRPGFIEAWNELLSMFNVLYADFGTADQNLMYPEQFRRLPCGIRRAEADNALGIATGASILQIPVWSRFRKEPQKSTGWLHSKERFINSNTTWIRTRSAVQKIGNFTIPHDLLDAQLTFLDQLRIMCQQEGWGEPENSPFPDRVCITGKGCTIYFRNSIRDQHASSLISGDHDQLLINGDVEHPETRYVLPWTANELWDKFVRDGSIFGSSITKPKTEAEKRFYDRVHTLADLRTEIGNTIKSIIGVPRNFIVTAEGAGKTRGILESIPQVDWLGGKIVIFACRSYDQAHEKMNEFEHLTGIKAAVLNSFSDQYKWLELPNKLTYEKAYRMGYRTLQDAVYACDPKARDELEVAKMKMWESLENSPIKVFFVVHAVAKQWHIDGGTRMWMHPDFAKFAKLRNGPKTQMLQELHDKIRCETEAGWVVFDEIEVDDLITMHDSKIVEWCNNLKQQNKGWRGLSKNEQLDAFARRQKRFPVGIEFSHVCDIIGIGYCDDDAYDLDVSIESFGINNAEEAIYAAVDGRCIYSKPCVWWSRLSIETRITVLTTEHRPLAIVESINQRARDQGRDERYHFCITVLDKPEIFPDDQVQYCVKLNSLARKMDIDHLISNIKCENPSETIITNYANDCPWHGNVATHQAAKGSNKYIGKDVTSLYTFISPELYARLLLEDIIADRNDMVKLFYLDMLNQSCGRNLGHRYRQGSKTTVIIHPQLWIELGKTLVYRGRYRIKSVSKKQSKSTADLAA